MDHVSVLLIHMNVHVMVTTRVMVKYVLMRLNAIPIISTSMNDMISRVDNIGKYHNECLVKSFKDLHSMQKHYTDIGDGCWRQNVLVAIIKCWRRFWPFWPPTSTLF